MPIQTNQELVQSAYDCFAKRDIPGILAKLSDAVIWEGPESPVLPYSGIFRGKTEVPQFFAGVAEMELSLFEPQAFINSGHSVVVIGHTEGKVKKTGKTFKSKWVMIFDVADEKIKRFHHFEETEVVAAAFRQ